MTFQDYERKHTALCCQRLLSLMRLHYAAAREGLQKAKATTPGLAKNKEVLVLTAALLAVAKRRPKYAPALDTFMPQDLWDGAEPGRTVLRAYEWLLALTDAWASEELAGKEPRG